MNKVALYILSATSVIAVFATVAEAGRYGYSSTSRILANSRVNSYSQYKMDGYNFRSHNSLGRLNYKRHFTLNRVYDRDRRSYRALRKLEK